MAQVAVVAEAPPSQRLVMDDAVCRERFNREPFAFEHTLHQSPLFEPGRLRDLARRYAARDAFVTAGAREAGQGFYEDGAAGLSAADALERLSEGSYRVLLKRLERYDDGFRGLLDGLMAEVRERCGVSSREEVVRLESFVFVSSAHTITPFHFDPEVGFFFQIAGTKTYHLYSPRALHEKELERHYASGEVDVGQVGLDGREQALETVFPLVPGRGHHQPLNSPHWVETGSALSVSYSFAFETRVTRSRGRVRGFNHYARRLGLRPEPPGASSVRDAVKAAAAGAMMPVLRGYWRLRDQLHPH